MIRVLTIIALFFGALVTPTLADAPAEDVKFYQYRIVNEFPHDTSAFTQGLFFHDGALYESTGEYGQSVLREVALETGETLRAAALPSRRFGEGSVAVGERIFVLTWRSGMGYVFDRETLREMQTFTYDGEGWGLTYDGDRLIMSDGTPTLRFLDPQTLQENGRLSVTFRGSPLHNLNELEWVDGEIFANVWQSDAIVRIDPSTGAVTGVIDLRGILKDNAQMMGADVLNGIAYQEETGRLFVTGKNWPSLFEVELTPHSAVD